MLMMTCCFFGTEKFERECDWKLSMGNGLFYRPLLLSMTRAEETVQLTAEFGTE